MKLNHKGRSRHDSKIAAKLAGKIIGNKTLTLRVTKTDNGYRLGITSKTFSGVRLFGTTYNKESEAIVAGTEKCGVKPTRLLVKKPALALA